MSNHTFPPRLQREHRTFTAMLAIYCRHMHGSKDTLCDDCAELASYARLRLSKCPYQSRKPTCANCPIHCYSKEMRERTREMMRFAGPRMLLRHPLLAAAHLIDGLRKPPDLSR